MKVIIQIPCFNEATTLPLVFKDMPRSIPGVDVLEYQIIDDGSTDQTIAVAKRLGVHHIVRVPGRNRRWLGRAFKLGIDHALQAGADIVVNTDGDNQYPSSNIPGLLAPVLSGSAQISIGDRNPGQVMEFSLIKRLLQRLGNATVHFLTGAEVRDAVSGFRAYSRDALLHIHIFTNYTYTIDTLLQAYLKGLTVVWVPIEPNSKTRESRLIRSIGGKVVRSGGTILRLMMVYAPLKTCALASVLFFVPAVYYIIRFLVHYALSGGAGYLQSLILAGSLLAIGWIMLALGVLGELIAANRAVIEDMLARIRRMELARAVPAEVAAPGKFIRRQK